MVDDTAPLTLPEVHRLMRKQIRAVGYGGGVAMCHAAGISHSYYQDIRCGRRPIPQRVLDVLGLRAVTVYEVVADPVALVKPPPRRKSQAGVIAPRVIIHRCLDE